MSDQPIQRKTDANSAGGTITVTIPNTTVFANNLLVSIDGSTGTPDSNAAPGNPHDGGVWKTANGSGTVFVNNTPVNYTTNLDTCGDERQGGSSDVFVGDDIDQDIPSTSAVIKGDEEEAETPPASKGGPAPGNGPGTSYFKEKSSSGTVSSAEASREGNVNATGVSSGAATKNKEPTSVDPGDVGDTFSDSLQLSASFTLGMLTKKPHIVFQHPVTTPNVQGIPTKTVVENLKLLAINTLEPIKAKYPNAFITNTYREDSKTQHGRGQAADIQFRGVTKSAYYDIACWIRDNVAFDQLLLEYKTTGSGLPWIHVSFKVPQRPTSDPTKVMTFLNDARERLTPANGYGLIQLSERT